MKISAIVPCYNHAKYVGRAIESVLSQTHADLELVVVDDASQDDSFAVIDRYHDLRIRKVRRARNGGVSHAINDGIRHCTGDAISILSADDTWPLEKMARQASFLAQNSDIVAVSGLARWQDDGGNDFSQQPSILESENRPQPQWLRRLFLGNCLGISTALIRASAVNRVGPQDPRLSILGDYDWWVKICLHAGQIHVLPEIMLNITIPTDGSNLSAPKPENYSAMYWQHSKVLQNYLQLSFDGLEAVFQKKVPDRSVTSVARELALIAAQINTPAHRLFAVEILFSDSLTRDDPDACRDYHRMLKELDPLNIQRRWLS